MLTLSTFWARAVSDTSRRHIGYVAECFPLIFLALGREADEARAGSAQEVAIQVQLSNL